MNAETRHVDLINKLTNFLGTKEVSESSVPRGEWETRYKQLKAIRAFFGMPWDKIEKEIKSTPFPEDWIWESRKDEAFKKYYKMRLTIDQMEVLLK